MDLNRGLEDLVAVALAPLVVAALPGACSFSCCCC